MANQIEVAERITRIREKATALFEDPEIADRWMCTRNRALGDAPINLLVSAKGTETVEAVLIRIEHGVFS